MSTTQTPFQVWSPGAQPLVEDGVDTGADHVKALRRDTATGRAPTILLRFGPGASYPNHRHPAGEEVLVLEGDVRFGGVHLEAGDYLYTPPGANHAVFSRSGCTLLLVVPEEVEIHRGASRNDQGPS